MMEGLLAQNLPSAGSFGGYSAKKKEAFQSQGRFFLSASYISPVFSEFKLPPYLTIKTTRPECPTVAKMGF